MKAIICKEWAKPEALVYEDVSDPVVQAGEVVIQVKAVGVNFADTLMVQGLYQVKPPLPFSPGFEVAGDIIELGSGVSTFKLGQRVAGFINWGAYAEKVAAPAVMLTAISDSMTYQAAASLAVAYGTSHVALDHRGKLKAGETLLVHGASGGVGLAAVELGKLMGATVIATASTQEKLELCKRYGADYTINYATEDFVKEVKAITVGKGADVIFDPVGGTVFEQSLRCIAWEGRLLVIGFASGKIASLPTNISLVKNCSVVGVYWGAYVQKNPAILLKSLAQLFSWHATGKITPHVSEVYKLEYAVAALNSMVERRSTGKIILEP